VSSLRFTGTLADLSASDRAVLLERTLAADPAVPAAVSAILARVRGEGDVALFAFAKDFDRAELQALEVPRAEWDAALAGLAPELRKALERAAANLEAVSRASLPPAGEIEVEPGVVVGRRPDPLARVGVYAPGGRATYPSSVLMGVVPARVAGVGEIVVCSPPGPDGRPSPVVLAAAALAGASRVFAAGGAGAIAALAYGTASIPRVDRIVGPGNAWVAEAKRQVSGVVGIDAPAGPSEILVLADETGDPAAIARELLAQAEHDPDACVVALAPAELAAAIRRVLEEMLPGQARREVIAAALRQRGAVLASASVDDSLAFANAFAPEHLLLAVADAAALLPRVRNAGTVFLGASSSVAFGDYLTGSNHVLPTAGAARRFSGLSPLDFVRWITWQRVDPVAASRLAADASRLATAEGLPAHAAAAAFWDRPVAAGPVRLRARATLRDVPRYVPERPPCEIDLTDNTNLFGIPDAVARALRELPAAAITRYPSPYSDRLREALAKEAGVDSRCVVTGAGSDDLLDATFAALAEPGERVAYCPPTFSMIPAFSRMNGLVPVPCALDARALAASGARLIYLCAPNNPTGALLPDGLLETLLARSGAIVVLDEAYVDFAPVPSRAREASASGRLVVIRTLSKAFGLAGLRIGFAVAGPDVAAELEKTRGPYKVGGVAEAAALAALSGARAWIAEHVEVATSLRTRLTAELVAAGFAPLPSAANFVLVPIAKNADATARRMRERGVSVRAFSALPEIGEALRISIGPWPMMERALAELREALA